MTTTICLNPYTCYQDIQVQIDKDLTITTPPSNNESEQLKSFLLHWNRTVIQLTKWKTISEQEITNYHLKKKTMKYLRWKMHSECENLIDQLDHTYFTNLAKRKKDELLEELRYSYTRLKKTF